MTLSEATVSSCSAKIRDLIPDPVAETARGNRPIGEEPKRVPASGVRAQQILKHCLK